jgi:hypothetical protein
VSELLVFERRWEWKVKDTYGDPERACVSFEGKGRGGLEGGAPAGNGCQKDRMEEVL